MDSPPPAPPTATNRRALGDVLLIAAVYLLPAIFNAFNSWFVSASPSSTVSVWLSVSVQAVGASALGLFLIFRSGEPAATFGLTRLRVSDLFLGLILWLGLFLVQFAFAVVIPADLFGLPAPSTDQFLPPPRSPLDYAVVAVGSCLNGFGEEVVMRAVLQTRLERLMRSAVAAIGVTAALFALYHAHYGPAGAVQLLFFGLAVGIVFRLGKCLWPVAIAHALSDFVPTVWSANVTN